MAISNKALLAMYQAGSSYKAMAIAAGMTVGAVGTRLARAGATPDRSPRLAPFLVQAILKEMREAHLSKTNIAQLAKRCGVSRKTLYNLEAAHGVPLYRSPEHVERYRASQPVSE